MATNPGSRWSIGLGEWGGVAVRLHWLLLLFAALAVGLTLDGSGAVGVLTAAILILSVVLHEAAHCIAALRLGGEVDEVVLSPIGGLRSPRVPDEPEPQVFVAMSGPMANLAVAFLAAVAVAAGESPLPGLAPLLDPMGPLGMLEGSTGVVALKLTVWINWTLFLLNLLPAYPFDGGPALRAVLWPLLGRRTAAVATAHTALVAAFLLVAAGVLSGRAEPLPLMPRWAPFVTLAVFLMASARRDLLLAYTLDLLGESGHHEARPYSGENLLGDEWPADGEEMVLVEHNSRTRRDQRLANGEVDDANEDARVDDILARLHDRGFDGLSEEEQAVLQRASRRYRSRRQDESEPE